MHKEHTMGFKNINPKQNVHAKSREANEERMASTEDGGVELADERLEDLAGGTADPSEGICPKSSNKRHYWYDTGETRPSKFWTNEHPDRKMRCKWCGETMWQRVLMA